MKRAFSLVEVLAAVALIGILVFLALPNIVQVKQDGEAHLADARCKALDLATASFVQAMGSSAAKAAWSAAGDGEDADQERYELVAPYLAYAPADLSAADGSGYMPAGYSAVFPAAVVPLGEVTRSP
jgi:prepilin-type N-terminal cleavage/methylation domain-containing protein